MIFSFFLPLLTETLQERLLGEEGWEGEVYRTHAYIKQRLSACPLSPAIDLPSASLTLLKAFWLKNDGK